VALEQQDIPPDAWDDGEVPPPERLTARAYIPDDARAPQVKSQLETALGHMSLTRPLPAPVYRAVHEDDWAEAWKAHYHPVRVGRRLLIRPQWTQADERTGDIVIALDPGMAFGTGTHPTTQLCLQALEDLVQPGINMLDLGCGSGILAIAAVKLGAAQVVALDSDPIAVTATQENARANSVADKIIAQEGSLESVITSAALRSARGQHPRQNHRGDVRPESGRGSAARLQGYFQRYHQHAG
jgi:ribosomal protein L11 methyltransferase